ncbi:unnamed protein product [Hermetia illucens]|uniref:Uncharacterized protein n=1 Tax=Hermetia illucens TaxID=343691 RepID=A0A7R8UT47_HERIL|nr:unnamed protein product [Hermetia illucens]
MDSSTNNPTNPEVIFEITTTPTPPHSEQNSNATSSPGSQGTPSPKKTTTSRRKSGHHRLILDDDISFEAVVLAEDDSPINTGPSSSTASTSGLQKDSSSQHSSPKKRKRNYGSTLNMNTAVAVNNDRSPNEELMRKAAFLRVSVNYLMLRLGKKPFDFSGPIVLSDMIGAYNRQNRLAQSKKEGSS